MENAAQSAEWNEDEQALDLLHEFLNELMDEELSLDDALTRIKEIYPADQHPSLAKLLETYRNGTMVYHSLIEDDNLKNLMIYFFGINPKIITLPVHEDSRVSLLDLLFDLPDDYAEIITWIKTNHPEITTAYQAHIDEIASFEEQLFNVIDKEPLSQFQEFLKTAPLDTLINSLTFDDDNRILTVILTRGKPYLHALINLDISILHVDFGEANLLSILCKKPKAYEDTLRLVSERYTAHLTDKDKKHLAKALKTLEIPAAKTHEKRLKGSPLKRMEKPVEQTFTLPKPPTPPRPPTPQPLLSLAEIATLSMGRQLVEPLMPYVNTRLLVDSQILDVFLHQMFFERLATRNIALLPTISNAYSIEPEQLDAVRSGISLSYSTKISIETSVVTSDKMITADFVDKPLPPGITHVVYPVCVDRNHYGIFVGELSPAGTPTLSKGCYIEPMKQSIIAQLILSSICDSLREQLNSSEDPAATQELLRHIIRRWMFLTKLRIPTQQLGISQDNLDYIFLSQDPGTNFCSDYVFAAIASLASGKIDLSKDFSTLLTMSRGSIDEEVVRRVRGLQINMFGTDYLELQLQDQSKACEVASLLKEMEVTDTGSAAAQADVTSPQAVKRRLSDSDKPTTTSAAATLEGKKFRFIGGATTSEASGEDAVYSESSVTQPKGL